MQLKNLSKYIKITAVILGVTIALNQIISHIINKIEERRILNLVQGINLKSIKGIEYSIPIGENNINDDINITITVSQDQLIQFLEIENFIRKIEQSDNHNRSVLNKIKVELFSQDFIITPLSEDLQFLDLNNSWSWIIRAKRVGSNKLYFKYTYFENEGNVEKTRSFFEQQIIKISRNTNQLVLDTIKYILDKAVTIAASVVTTLIIFKLGLQKNTGN